MINLSGPEIQKFINDHLYDDIADLILKHSEVKGVSIRDLALQIQSKSKARDKLPDWFHTFGLVYPPPISIEQCSSEKTARFKASMFAGNRALDLTGGAGIDTYYLSKSFQHVDYVEIEQNLVEVARHNFKVLNASNIDCHQATSEGFLEKNKLSFDLVFIDPARRLDGEKVFQLNDCTPDILKIQENLLAAGQDVLIKTSPLLDIHKTIRDLRNVNEVIVLGIKNEVKEVLYHLNKDINKIEPQIRSVNITSDGGMQEFTFLSSEERQARSNFSNPDNGCYLYEPNSSILKAGAFKLTAVRYGLDKLDINTHMFSSVKLTKEFPGRIFRIIQKYTSLSTARKDIQGSQANIISRNFPLKAHELKDKLKTKDGSEDYLIAAKVTSNKKAIFKCERIK